MEFFDYANPLRVYEGDLPHWQQRDVPYFVTFRLADSIPSEKLCQWKFERENWFRTHSEPYTEEEQRQFHFLFSERVQDWLDSGLGSCVLRNAVAAGVVRESLLHFDGRRYALDEWVIMQNHVHLVVIPQGEYVLETILHTWKSYTAHEVNSALGRRGTLWQHESYDHLVRSEKQLAALRLYIRNNPSRKPTPAVLKGGDVLW